MVVHVMKEFTPAQRDMLIDHIDGALEVSTSRLVTVRRALLARKLIRPYPAGAIRPRQTTLTEHGRCAVCRILGDYADALVRAGILEQDDPVRSLLKLSASIAAKGNAALRSRNL